MAQDRDDRMMMRQRGAGSHKIKEADFGLSFPAPSASRPSARRVSSASSRPSTSSRQPISPSPGQLVLRPLKTGELVPEEPKQNRRSGSATAETFAEASLATYEARDPVESSESESRATPTPLGQSLLNTARPEGAPDVAVPSTATPPLGLKRKRGGSPSHVDRVLRSTPRQDANGVAEDRRADQGLSNQHTGDGNAGPALEWFAHSFGPQDVRADREDSFEPVAAAGLLPSATGRTEQWTDFQARLAGVQSTPEPDITQDDAIAQPLSDVDDFLSEIRDVHTREAALVRDTMVADGYSQSEDSVQQQQQYEPDQEEEDDDDEDEIGLQGILPMNRSASGVSRASSVASSRPGSRQGGHTTEEGPTASRVRHRPVSSGPGGAPERSARSGSLTRPTRPKPAPGRSAALRMQAARNMSRKKGAQVLVYRMVEAQPASTSEESNRGKQQTNDEDEDEEDDLQAGPKFVRRPGVNAVDVFNQLFRELIEAHMQSLQEAPPPQYSEEADGDDWADDESRIRQHKALTKRRIKAMEAFGRELEQRNFQLTECLDANQALGMRLRQATREKKSLGDHLIHLRRQRDEIARKIDEVKSTAHERDAASKKHDFLNGGLRDVELAFKRGWMRTADAASTDGRRRREKEEHDDDVEANNVELWLTKYAGDMTTTTTLFAGVPPDYSLLDPHEREGPRRRGGDEDEDEEEDERRVGMDTGHVDDGSSGPDRGGILRTIRAFNEFLERSLSLL